ncbi:MAG: hypothetical protein LBT37_03470 [Lactobacillaceae bacterium]|jgi:hypothetical protein|nr:hypothetical protein [Lactobacillaceae bacterium]
MNKVTRVLISSVAVGLFSATALVGLTAPFANAATVPPVTAKQSPNPYPNGATFVETASDCLTVLNVNDPIIAPLGSNGARIKIKVTDTQGYFNLKVVGKNGDQVINYALNATDDELSFGIIDAYPVDKDTTEFEVKNNSVKLDDGSVKDLKPGKEYSIYVHDSSFFNGSVDNLEISGSNIDFTVSKYVASQGSDLDIL